jgi:hypothetical protein
METPGTGRKKNDLITQLIIFAVVFAIAFFATRYFLK